MKLYEVANVECRARCMRASVHSQETSCIYSCIERSVKESLGFPSNLLVQRLMYNTSRLQTKLDRVRSIQLERPHS